jgi:branched-chain amino acid transport system ATP-binding protein
MSIEMTLREVRAGYDSIEVLHGVSLYLPAGRVTGLAGPNGAGKTTILRVVSGELPLRAGQVCWHGIDIGAVSVEERASAGLVSIPADGGVFPHLRVRENLAVFSDGKSYDAALAAFPRLGDRLTSLAGTLSGGEQRMLALSRLLLTTPTVVLVDEPSMGLADVLIDQVYGLLTDLAARGAAVLIADQHTDRLTATAHVLFELKRGQIAFAGEPSETGWISETQAGSR